MEDKSKSFQKTNLIQLLRTFSKDEMTEFDKFVRSPFHNNRNEVTRFFQAIKKFHPSFDDENFTKEKIFAKLHPKKKYRDDVMRRLSHNLHNIGEKYLIYKPDDEFPIKNKLRLMSRFVDRGLESQLHKLDKEIFIDLHKFAYRDELYYMSAAKYYDCKCGYEMISHKKEHGQELLDSFLEYAVLFLLKQYCIMMHDTRHMKKKYEYNFLSYLLNYLDNKKTDIKPGLKIYFSMLKFNLNQDDENLYKKFKDNFIRFGSVFQKLEQRSILCNLMAHCEDEIFKSNKKFIMELHNLHKFQCEKGLFYEYIDFTEFTNIIVIAHKCRQLKWAKKFFETFQKKLDPSIKQKAINYSLVLINNKLEKYDDSLKYLAKVVPVDFNMKMTIKLLFFGIYFDMNNFESIYYLIDSAKHFIKNHELDELQHFDIFLKFYEKLVRIKEKNEIHKLMKLKGEIKSNSYFPSKIRILEKVEEMEKTSLKLKVKS